MPQTGTTLHTSGLHEPSPDLTVHLTNERMDDGRWNRLMNILFTPQDAEPSPAR